MHQVGLDQAIGKSQEFLLSLQQNEGYWWASLESNVTMTAEAILLHKLYRSDRDRPMQKALQYLQNHQCKNGSWELYKGDGGNLSVSIEAYMGLRLLDIPADADYMVKAREFILEKGGITKARIFTKMHLAVIGCYDWRGLPSIPPWIMLLPNEISPFTIYEMSSWARGSTVPLTVVFDRKPVWLTEPAINLDELYLEGSHRAKYELPRKGDWTDAFVWLDQVFKISEELNLTPFRLEGLAAAEKWILERQEATGDWAGIIPAMLNSLLAMRALQYDVNDPVVSRGLAALDRFAVETDEEYWIQPCLSPVWDTALVMRSLAESGIPANHLALKQGADWLINMQILDYGDWSVKNKKGLPGAWAFEFDNRFYPDVDDTAVVVMALQQAESSNELLKQKAIDRAVRWIETMQCRPGGWAAFDLDNDQDWLNDLPYGDLRAMIDPNTADVTARVLEMVGYLDAPGLPITAMEKAITYLLQEQEPEGCWFGRWGVNYIYGTYGVLTALQSLDKIQQFPLTVIRAVEWLIHCQNPDGGWGETCQSYSDRSLMGQGDSTPSQTAWGLMGLIAGSSAIAPNNSLFDRLNKAMERSALHLIHTQDSNGKWSEEWHTGTGFPEHFYLKYHLYCQHFPLTALARYRSL
jgi:squalene-hopene/tetraprenyl-beta-curcumene cyclase